MKERGLWTHMAFCGFNKIEETYIDAHMQTCNRSLRHFPEPLPALSFVNVFMKIMR